MDFSRTENEEDLRREARLALAEPDVAAALSQWRSSPHREPEVRPLYRALGRRGLLAVGWPREHGGRGASHTEAAAVMEELVTAGVPDLLQVLSVQIFGLFLLQAGTEEQQRRYLPGLASGERFATVLYTEPEAGSDLASLRTTAVAAEGGHRLSGVKQYSVKAGVCDVALCAARTDHEAGRYEGISLFIVDLAAEGVSRSTVPGIADDQFDRVEFDDVFVGADDLLGRPGEGWSLLTRCLAIERTGLDYWLKSARWYAACLAGLRGAGADAELAAAVGRHGAAVSVGRLLTHEVIDGIDRGVVDAAGAAGAKLHCSQAAQDIATWAGMVHGRAFDLWGGADAAVLESAFREAPGVTLAAGTSQIMLEILASSLTGRGPRSNGGDDGPQH